MREARLVPAWAPILIGLLLAACTSSADKTTPDAGPHPRVVVGPVVMKSVPLRLEYVGNIKPLESAAIKARVTGRVMAFHFREGTDVKKGELLFTIDPRPYEATLNQAKAKLARDEAKLAYAMDQVARYAKLAKDQFISQLAYDGYITNSQSLEAEVREDRAAIRLAQLNVDYCSIVSPFDGRAGIRLVDPGNLVTSRGGPSDPTLVVINQIDPIKAIFAVPEQDLIRIREAKNVSLEVRIPGKANHPFPGKLWLIDNEVNTASGMIKLEGMLPNPERLLWPGQFVEVSLQISTLPNTILVPSEALSNSLVGTFVFVVGADSKVEKRRVETGSVAGNSTIVTSGLKAGEKVVVEGRIGLQSGMQVRVAP